MIRRCLLSLFVVCAALLGACTPKRTPLVVYAAGSLIVPFSELELAFEAQHAEIDVLSEFHGSIQVMRHVTDLHEEIDVVATADRALIPMLMYANAPDTGSEPYATWNIGMAGNRMAIAYTPNSKYASEISQDNWWQVLAREDVRVGLSDPRFDAVGYRGLMVLAMAEDHYEATGLYGDILDGQFRTPIQRIDLDDRYIIRVPEVLETKEGSHIRMRGSSVALISLLQAGEIDYAFEYESVIRQHGFDYVELPPELNMGEPDMEDAYGRATVVLDFQRFATVKPEFHGEQIAYGITIPSNAPHPEAAALYLEFLFSEEGQEIMAQNHHPLHVPARVDAPQNLPAELALPLDRPSS